jgi:HEAT repeat protein
MSLFDVFKSAQYKGKSIRKWISELSGTDAQLYESMDALVAAGSSAVPDLIKNLDSSNEDIQRLIPVILGKIGSPANAAIPALESSCKSRKASVGLGARMALINITGDIEPHLTIIADALKSDDPKFRSYAALALKMLGEKAKPVGEKVFNFVREETLRDGADVAAIRSAEAVLSTIGAPHPFRY